MRLLSINLHPFGRFTDETRDLSQPLVVIHGPNELGKTTIRQAIFHALFTPTNLTPAQFRTTIQPWLPLPDGDHAAVTLTFIHDNSTWKLEKRWGAGQSSRLSDGTTAIADPAAVQQRLGKMLVHGEATFRHVLFTGQAELERTLATIDEKVKAGELRDIRDLLQATADASADVDEQRLRQKLDEKIEEAFGRWDDVNGRPEPQNGQDRGIANPWKKDVGDILGAWYAWKRLVADRDRLLGIERQIDEAGALVAALEAEIQGLRAFVQEYASVRQGLGDRELLEARIPRLKQDVAALTLAFTQWPQATAAIEAWKTLRPDIETRLAKTQEELAAAQTKRNAATTLKSFAAIKAAKQEWETAVEAVQQHPDPGEDLVREIDRLETAIQSAKNKLAAQSLSWRIETDQPGTVTVERGGEPAETLPVGPDPATGVATARVKVIAAGITLTVASGEEDVDALFRSIADHRDELTRQLAKCNAASPEAAHTMADKHLECAAAAKSQQKIYEGLLQSRTFEQWEEEVDAIERLPATREITAIDRDIKQDTKQLTDGDTVAAKHEKSIENWSQLYQDFEKLTERLLKERATLDEANKQLEKLPKLPEGFESAAAFRRILDEKQRDLDSRQQQLPGLRQQFGQLNGELENQRSEDMAEQAAAAERAFNRARAQGRAYQRIRQALDRLAAAGGDDPLADFSERVAGLFSRITGGATTLRFDGQLPATVVRGAVSLPPDRLSQGGGGALALAVRLAMAEAYVDEGDGFVMLDDSLVNFDSGRMAVAATILREFSQQAQVIFFTCHDHHAARLEGDAEPARQPAPVPAAAG